jgi:hypothetical protein
MFAFPQTNRGDNLLMDREFGLSAPMQNSDLYFDIGLLNQSEHWACETMTLKGETPRVLARLAEINLVKGEERTARLFIENLHRTLFFKHLARRYEAFLEDESRIEGLEDIFRLRGLLVENDFITMDSGTGMALEKFVDAVPDNRVAFEYLMALYLLSGRLGSFAEKLPRLRSLGYSRIPRIYEEALLLYLARTGRTDFDIAPFQVSRDTFSRYRAFGETFTRYKNDRKAAQQALGKTYGRTYWYYALFPGTRSQRPGPIQTKTGGVR